MAFPRSTRIEAPVIDASTSLQNLVDLAVEMLALERVASSGQNADHSKTTAGPILMKTANSFLVNGRLMERIRLTGHGSVLRGRKYLHHRRVVRTSAYVLKHTNPPIREYAGQAPPIRPTVVHQPLEDYLMSGTHSTPEGVYPNA